jgi:hypothetical protein
VSRDEDVLAAVEVPVEGGVGDADRLRDPGHARAGQPVLGDQPQGFFDYLGSSFGAGPTTLILENWRVDRRFHAVSIMVATPCPPPMHMVASP